MNPTQPTATSPSSPTVAPTATPRLRTMQVEVAEGVIDLGVGQPGYSLLPLERLRRATAHRFAQQDPAFLQYGPEEGDGYFNLALADFLTAEYGTAVRPDQLFITNGISQALDLICTLFTKPGDTVLVEEPTYFLVFQIFQDHGLRIEPVALTAEGLDLDRLEETLQTTRPAFLYTIPTFQNPAGVTMPQANRDRLVALCRQHELLLVADEVYQMLHYTQKPPLPFGAYVDDAPILSLGSFSKILAPGLRLGWVQAAPATVKRFVASGIVTSGGGLNPLATAVVQSALALEIQQEHLQWLRGELGARMNVMGEALHQALPEEIPFTTPGGGYFFWLALPPEVDVNMLLPRAAEQHVGFRPGNLFSSTESLRNCLRLCFAYYEQDVLAEGVARLARVLASPSST